jgi:outer membrane biosynthesis protein TonB
MPFKPTNRIENIRAYLKRRGRFLATGILISLVFHIVILVFMPTRTHKKPVERVPVTLNIKKKPKPEVIKPDPKQDDKKEEEKKKEEDQKQIIEAPLMPTEAPDVPANLGRQNHKAVIEQKTEPKASIPGADSSALQNGRLRIEGGIPDNKGTIPVPAKQGKKYSRLLPQQGELINLAHNDYVPNPKIPKGAMLDVNTTDFRWIGYFSMVRRLVEMAFTDIGPTLRSSPYVKSRLAEAGKASFQGESKIKLKIEKSGLLTETRLVSSSGDKEIDGFWDRILNVAAPYPPLPKDYPEESLEFTYTLYYDIVIQGEEKVRRFVY